MDELIGLESDAVADGDFLHRIHKNTIKITFRRVCHEFFGLVGTKCTFTKFRFVEIFGEFAYGPVV